MHAVPLFDVLSQVPAATAATLLNDVALALLLSWVTVCAEQQEGAACYPKEAPTVTTGGAVAPMRPGTHDAVAVFLQLMRAEFSRETLSDGGCPRRASRCTVEDPSPSALQLQTRRKLRHLPHPGKGYPGYNLP